LGVLVLLVFLAVVFLGLGITVRLNRSELMEKLEGDLLKTSRRNVKELLKILSRKTMKLSKGLGFETDLSKYDKKLYLAGQPFNLNAEEALGVMSFIFCVTLIIAVSLWVTGKTSPILCLLMIFTVIAVPLVNVRNNIELGREKVSTETVDLCLNMELAISAGLQPLRVITWASETGGLLAGILRDYKKEVELGKQLHWMFSKIGDDYDIPEAKEIALALKHEEIQGVSIAQHLSELAKDFRSRREHDLETKVSKIKPGVTTILVISCLIAGVFLMLGPVIVDNIESFSMMTQY